jgi:hypothetical protein
VLEHRADRLALRRELTRDLEMVDAAQQRRLARARGADQARDVAGGDVEVAAFEYVVVALALVVGVQRQQRAGGSGDAHHSSTPRPECRGAQPGHVLRSRPPIVGGTLREEPRPNRRPRNTCPIEKTLVSTRYQIEATISSGITGKVLA